MNFGRLFVYVVLGLGIAFATLTWSGLRYNHTRSEPLGFYWVVHKPLEKGDLVMLEPGREVSAIGEVRGYWNKGDLLLKRVVAKGGDHVIIIPEGLMVNGEFVSDTWQLDVDRSGRVLAKLEMVHAMREDEILVASNNDPYGFDSRYFGPVPVTSVRCIVRPLLTWK